VIDEILRDTQRLDVLHVCLGIFSAAIYWVRQATMRPYSEVTPGRIFGWAHIIILTFFGWAPYLVSWWVARALLPQRDEKATIFFIACATLTTMIAAGFYLNLIPTAEPPAPAVIALCVSLTLIAVTGLCTLFWHSDLPGNESP